MEPATPAPADVYDALVHCFAWLDTPELLTAGLVSKSWALASRADALWIRAVSRDFAGLQLPGVGHGSGASSGAGAGTSHSGGVKAGEVGSGAGAGAGAAVAPASQPAHTGAAPGPATASASAATAPASSPATPPVAPTPVAAKAAASAPVAPSVPAAASSPAPAADGDVDMSAATAEAPSGALPPITQHQRMWRRLLNHWGGPRGSYVRRGYLARSVRAVGGLRAWARTRFPCVAESLRDGATEAQLDAAEHRVGTKFPPAMRCLYRLCDGQDVSKLGADRAGAVCAGVFGGTFVYGTRIVRCWLPLQMVTRDDGSGDDSEPPPFDPGALLVFAACLWPSEGARFSLDCTSGRVWARSDSGTSAPCTAVGPGLGCVVPVVSAPTPQPDGLLVWLEEYVRRLTTGVYAAADVPADTAVLMRRYKAPGRPLRYISVIRNDPPVNVEARTQGVVVQASPLLLSPFCTKAGDAAWTYRIRCRMDAAAVISGAADASAATATAAAHAAATAGAGADGSRTSGPGTTRLVTRCQLRSRHWFIAAGGPRDPDLGIEEVQGPGVIGLYPQLSVDDEPGVWFSYQSCTTGTQEEPAGTMWGTFAMAPGSLAAPQGPDFDVEVPVFTLRPAKQEEFLFC